METPMKTKEGWLVLAFAKNEFVTLHAQGEVQEPILVEFGGFVGDGRIRLAFHAPKNVQIIRNTAKVKTPKADGEQEA